jgi:hypothetical protein
MPHCTTAVRQGSPPLATDIETGAPPPPCRIAVIRGLGGNGGTFLARVLLAMPEVVLLSECNPRSANLFAFELNPIIQIKRHYPQFAAPLAGFHPSELGNPRRFRDAVEQILGVMPPAYRLVIRDYNFADFHALPFAWGGAPRSSLDEALRGLPYRQINLVRHPFDQFMSLLSHDEIRSSLEFGAFLDACIAALDAFPDAWIVSYEWLFGRFAEGLLDLCGHFGIPWDPGYAGRMPLTTWVTGSVSGRSTAEPGFAAAKDHGTFFDPWKDDPRLASIRARCGYGDDG